MHTKAKKATKAAVAALVALSVLGAGCNAGNNQAGGRTSSQGVQNNPAVDNQGILGTNRDSILRGGDDVMNDGANRGPNDPRGSVVLPDDRGAHGGHQAGAHRGAQHVDIAQEAAEKVAAIPEVSRANVLLMGGNAYVAAVVDQGGQLHADLEKRIADTVRASRADVANVYVSTNPGFVQMATDYIHNFQEGRPVTGFIQRFTEMVERLFPTAR